jgi:hypothetical protein
VDVHGKRAWREHDSFFQLGEVAIATDSVFLIVPAPCGGDV